MIKITEKNIFGEINQKKLKLGELRPLSEETIKSLRESTLLIDIIYILSKRPEKSLRFLCHLFCF